MRPTRGRRRGQARWLAILVVSVATGLAAGRAEAQISVGFGPFGGYVGIQQSYPTTDYVNQLSAIQAQGTYAQRNQAMGALDNSNAYYNKLRSPDFSERYDYQT